MSPDGPLVAEGLIHIPMLLTLGLQALPIGASAQEERAAAVSNATGVKNVSQPSYSHDALESPYRPAALGRSLECPRPRRLRFIGVQENRRRRSFFFPESLGQERSVTKSGTVGEPFRITQDHQPTRRAPPGPHVLIGVSD